LVILKTNKEKHMTTSITLRQAHKLVDKIVAKMRTLTIESTKQVSAWEQDEVSAVLERLRGKFEEQIARQVALTNARQELRDAISIANRAAVDGLISQRKALLDQVGIYRAILDSASENYISDGNALAQKLSAMRSAAHAGATTPSWGGSGDTVTVSLLTSERQTVLEKLVNDTQLKIEAVEDALTQANAGTRVWVPASAEATLRQEGLIA
jgi:hypothetical protein